MRILALSDQIHPFIHQTRFPGNLPPFDLVLIAGDLSGDYIEFVATKVTVPVFFVHGNHNEEYVQDYLGNLSPPGGAIALHDKVVKLGNLWLAGWGGSPRYNNRDVGQYQESQAQLSFVRRYPKLALRRFRTGHGVDILLSHAPPPGPHAGPDHAHRGSTALGYFHRLYRPRLHVHGHVHLYEAQPKREYVSPEGVRVVNAFEYALIEL